MKKLFSLLLASASLSVAVAQTPVNISKAIVQKATATWCGPCGAWGWTLHEEIMTDNMPASNPKAFVLTEYASTSSNYYNATAGELGKWLQSYPNWGFNNNNWTAFASGGGIYTTTTRNNIKKSVDSFYAIAPTVSTGFTYSISGNTVNINTVSKFWKAASGNYYLGVYVIEDSVFGYQNGQASNVYHHYVLRDKASTGIYGDALASGSINANQTYNKNFSYTITDNTWNKGRIKILTVLWKQNGANYDFVNSNAVKSSSAGLEDLAELEELTVFPSPASNYVNVSGAWTAKGKASIALVNTLGQTVYQTSTQAASGQLNQHISLDNISNGMYLLQISSGTATVSKRIVVSK